MACKTLGVVKTSISLYIIPVLGVVFAMISLGERVSIMDVAGGCVILTGMAIATKRCADEGKGVQAQNPNLNAIICQQEKDKLK